MRDVRPAKRRWGVGVLVASILAVGLIAPVGAYPRPGTTGLAGGSATSCSSFPFSDIDARGRTVAFATRAPLILTDTDLACDIYVRDVVTGEVERVTISSTGAQSVIPDLNVLGWAAYWPSMSSNGRFVAFTSYAANLVPGDTNNERDVFVRDRKKQTTIRVSVASDGAEGEEPSYYPSISGNGKLVAFNSDSALAGDREGIFVRDLESRRTVKVDDDPKYQSSNIYASLSRNGRYVVYTVNPTKVMVKDLQTGETKQASLFPDGSEPTIIDGDTYGLSFGGRWISDDGRFVVFSSHVGKFVPSDTNPRCDAVRATMPDVFVRDMKTGRTERVSVHSTGEEAEFGAGPGVPGGNQTESCGYVEAGISGNGRFVSFSSSTNFFKGDTGQALATGFIGGLPGPRGDVDSYVFDRKTGTLHWTSVASDGTEAKCEPVEDPLDGVPVAEQLLEGVPVTAQASSLSRTGRYATFFSCASNLAEEEELPSWADDELINIVLGSRSLFIRDLGPTLGIGDLGGTPQEEPQDDRICITPDICLPPGSALAERDARADVTGLVTSQGGNIFGLSAAYRPDLGDMLLVVELEEMPGSPEAQASHFSGSRLLLYGVRFKVGERVFEVRANGAAGGTFGLFDCSGLLGLCSKASSLRGGFGTTGERVVVSLPLGEIGLEDGGEIRSLEAFSALGSFHAGPSKILDTARLN